MRQTRRRGGAVAVAANSGGHHASTSRLKIIVGVGMIALFLVAFMTQIQTNEASILHSGQVEIYRPNWAILAQIPVLLFGGASPQEAMATIVGWGIELLYLGCVVGFDNMHDSAGQGGWIMARVFLLVSIGLALFNWWNDFNYGTIGVIDGQWGHIIFACMTSFISGYFGTIGLHLIERGWNQA